MAEWWESAPLVEQKPAATQNWWESAPKVEQDKPAPRTYTAQQMADELSLPVPGTDWRTPEQPVRYKSPIPGGDFMNELATSMAENVPIVGPLVDRAAQATGAQLGSMISGQSPEEVQAQRDVARARNASEQPVANAAGTVAGTVGPLMALGQTQLVGRALGITGPMAQRIAAGTVSGATIAGGDALARGAGGTDAAQQAALGAALGGSMPLAERPMMAIARMLAGQGTPAQIRAMDRSLNRAGIDPRDIGRRLDELGPSAMPLDLDPNLTRQGAAVASLPGEGQTTLSNAMTARQQGANARIQGDVDATLGPATSPMQFNQGIRDAQKALSPQYEAVLEGAQPVNVANIANRLDALEQDFTGDIGSALAKVRTMLNDKAVIMPKSFGQALNVQAPLISDPRRLLNVRHDLDDLVGAAQGNQRRVLRDVRQMIDDELAKAAPGIKEVDKQYEALAKQREGFEQGQQALDSGRTALTPSDLRNVAQASSEQVLGAMSQGARSEIDRLIGTTANNITALKSALKGDGSWNRDRLVTLFGQDKADRLLNVLEREQTFANSFNKIMQNSETAARLAAQNEAAPRKINLEIGKLLTGIPEAAANLGARARSEGVNARLADLLTQRPTPETIDQLLTARRLGQGLLGAAPVPLLTNQ